MQDNIVFINGMEQFRQMLKSHINNDDVSDLVIDERGRVTDKRDSICGEVFTDFEMARLFQNNIDDEYYHVGGYDILKSEVVGVCHIVSGSFDLYSKIRDEYKKTGITIPLYKILASCALRYNNSITKSSRVNALEYDQQSNRLCSHVSEINLMNYRKFIKGQAVLSLSILLASQKYEYDVEERILCDSTEYSDFCDLRLLDMSQLKDEGINKLLKTEEELLQEITHPEECTLGYKLHDLVGELLSFNRRELIRWTSWRYTMNYNMVKILNRGIDPDLVNIVNLEGDENDENEVAMVIQKINELCLKRSIPIVRDKITISTVKSARKVMR